MIRIFPTGVEIFVDGDAPLFRPHHSLRYILKRKEADRELLLKPFQNLVKLVSSVVTHRKRQSVA